MNQFNIGDRVRAVKDSKYYPIFKKGDKGTVIDNINSTTVKFDKRDGIWKCSPDEIELIEQPEVVGKVIKGGKHQPKFYLDDEAEKAKPNELEQIGINAIEILKRQHEAMNTIPEHKPFPLFEDSHQKINELVYHQDVKGIYDYFAQFGVREVEVLPSNIRKTLIEFIDSIRAYEDEAGHSIYDDERDSSEFADIFLKDYDVSNAVKTVEVMPEVDGIIKLSKFEIQSGIDRVNHAEGLISQLPATHDGRNTWLLNYGRRKESWDKRAKKMLGWNRDTQSVEIRPIQPSKLEQLKARKSELSDTEKDELIELLIKENSNG